MPRRHQAAMAIAILSGCGGEATVAPPSSVAIPARPPPPVTASPSAEAPPAPLPKPALADLERKAMGDWYAAFNAHDARKLGSLYSADATSTRPGPGGWSDPQTGQDAIAKAFADLFTGFPDLKASPIRVFQKQHLVAVQWASVGTNEGKLMGPATNKKAGLYGCDVFLFDDSGAIKRQESFHDDATTMRQLGKLPGKAPDLAVLPDKEADWVMAAGTPEEDALVESMKSTWPLAWTKRDVKAYGAVLNDESEHVDYSVPSDLKGRPALIKELEAYARALPDMQATVEKAWGFAPNTVIAEFTLTGTLKGNLGPLKATNKAVTLHGLAIDELKDGKLQKRYTFANSTELLDAAGALPKPKPQHPGHEEPQFGMIGVISPMGGVDPNAPTAPWGPEESSGIGDQVAPFPHSRASGQTQVRTPHIRDGAVSVNGRLPQEVVQRIVRQNFGRFRLCYENGLRGNPILQGRIAVKFVIDGSGDVSMTADGGSDVPDQDVIQCVLRGFGNLHFPQPASGMVTVVYPIMLSPGDK